MILSQLVRQANVETSASFGDAEVSVAQLDSRKCAPGTLYFCMPGTRTDSHAYLPAALAAGASAAVVYSAEGLEAARAIGMPAILPSDPREAAWRLCDALYGHPTRHMKVVGITGTNGKTTTAWLVRDMLAALGMKAGYLGTLGFQIPGGERELANTTPFTVDLYNLLKEARDRRVEALAMEVSSHALAEKRADGVEFDVAVFTNLTQDHLDFHGTMEAYEAAKWRLFSDLPRQTEKRFRAAINVGDPTGARWAAQMDALTFAISKLDFEAYYEAGMMPAPDILADWAGAALHGTPKRIAVDQIHLELGLSGQADATVRANLGGAYNAENLISACAAVYALGEVSDLMQGRSQSKLELVANLASHVRPVPGRFEPVPNEAGIGILVDYAHTPDAVEKLLDTVRPLAEGRIITVIGCGGDRDKTKRPKMARAASERSDLTVVTSDNPRTEDPRAILADVVSGIVPGRDHVAIIDRAEAVAHAVRAAKPGDVVVIAGKGHENYQIIGREKLPMDDRELARSALR